MLAKKERLKLSLKRWQLRQQRTKHPFYFVYIVFILCFAYVIDELATNLNTILQDKVIETFFHGTDSENLTLYTILITAASAISILSFLYKTLADRFGRKPFIVINTIGMGVGMFLCFIAQNLFVYCMGLLMIGFFVPCDIQIVYVLEYAPDKHRSFWLAFYKAIAVMSVAIVSPLRSWAVSLGNWQFAFLIPAIIGVAAGVVMFFFMRETDTFANNKIQHLKKEIRNYGKPKPAKKNLKDAQGGIISAIKFMFQNKHLLWLFLIGVIFSICAVGMNNYSQIMSSEFTKTMTQEAAEQKIATILLVYPFVTALIEVIAGILSDKFGRKKANIFTGFMTLIGFLYFVVGIKTNWHPVVAGMCLGFFVGGYFSSIDIFNVICAEQSPTNLRSSILSIVGISVSVGSFIATALLLIFLAINPVLDLGFFGIILIIPTLFAGLLILAIKIPETKAISLDDVGEEKKVKKEKDEDIRETEIKL